MANENEKGYTPLERSRGSYNNLREYRRKDSANSTTSSLDALDFLADMCVEIDEIGTTMAGVSPRESVLATPTSSLPTPIPPALGGAASTISAATTSSSSTSSSSSISKEQQQQYIKKFFQSSSSYSNDQIDEQQFHTQHPIKSLKREVSEISPRSRSSLTPASNVSRTLSKGFSFSSVGSNIFGPDPVSILNGRSDSVEDRLMIPLTLYHYGENGIYLVPTNPQDIPLLIKGSQQNNHNSVFTVSVTHGDTGQHLNQLSTLTKIIKGTEMAGSAPASSPTLPSYASSSSSPLIEPLKLLSGSSLSKHPSNSSSSSTSASPSVPVASHPSHHHQPHHHQPQHQSHHHHHPASSAASAASIASAAPVPVTDQQPPVKLINPKHIYKTSCDTFRVQMSKGSKINPNGKFSRNTRNEIDALWLCEFALLLVERPSNFDDILMNGNYKCMVQRKIVSSPDDFTVKLFQQMNELSSRGLLKPAETEKLTHLLHKFLPQYHHAFGTHASNTNPIPSPSLLLNEPLQESPLAYSFYSTDPLFNSTLPKKEHSNKSFFTEEFNPNLYSESQSNGTVPVEHSKPSDHPYSYLDNDQKKRRRGGQTPVMVQRNESLQESKSSTSPNRPSSPTIYLHPMPGGPASSSLSSAATSSSSSSAPYTPLPLPLTSQNLSQVNSSKLRSFPELSLLTSQYVKQKSRSFEDTINVAPIDQRNQINQNPYPDNSPLRKFV